MLHTLSPAKGSRSNRKRVGRGSGSGNGTTAGRGNKGQQARSGHTHNFAFEGGQTPLLRRQPKLGGFKNPNRKEYEVLNVGTLDEKLDAGSYDVQALRKSGIACTSKPLKILARGDVRKKFALTVDGASKSAIAAIEKAGGSVTVV